MIEDIELTKDLTKLPIEAQYLRYTGETGLESTYQLVINGILSTYQGTALNLTNISLLYSRFTDIL